MSATIVMNWDCEHGCPPIRMEVPVEINRDDSEPGLALVTSTERGERLVAMGAAAHMAGVHS